MFFDGWQSIREIVLTAVAVYVGVLAALRLVGEQALAQMSAYDLIVTIALGSLVAAIPLSADVTITDGLAAILTFLLLQEATRWMMKRWPKARRLIKEQPKLLAWEGRLLPDRMARAWVTEEEVRAAIRRAGRGDIADVQAVILENDGQWSVIPRADARGLSAFEGLELPRPHSAQRAD
jgi:uncharacterized membrane protein YcaP (DUF421 family)